MLETGTVLVVSVLSLQVTDKLSYVRNTNCIWWLAFSLYKSLTNILMLETLTVLMVSVLSLLYLKIALLALNNNLSLT